MKSTLLLSALTGALFLGGMAPAQTPDFYDLDTVREIRLTFKQPNWWSQLDLNYASKTDIEADMVVDNLTFLRVGVRFRGNTSYRRLPPGCEKKSFNILLDAFVPGQAIQGYNHLNLNNGFHDPTFCRELIMYQYARKFMCAPKANFIKLYLNNAYWGIYINVQQPNKDMMEEWFRTNDGNRYRGAPPAGGSPHGNSALIYLGPTVSYYTKAYDFKQGDGSDLLNLIKVLNQTPTNQIQTELPKIWSVDQGYWYCALMNIMVQLDSYIGSGKDHFLYHDEVHSTFHIFPFDMNEALGGEGQGNPTTSPFLNLTNWTKPVLSKTCQFPDWRARYVAHYRTILEDFSWKKIGGLVTKYQNMISKDVIADTKKIYPTSAFTSNVTQNFGFGPSTIRGLKPLVEARHTYLLNIADFKTTRPSLSGLLASPANPSSNQSVTVTVKASANAAKVTLYHREIGPFIAAPMFDDGQHGDGAANDGVYGALIPPASPGALVDYYVGAATSAGVTRFLPSGAEFQSPQYWVDWIKGSSPVKINEFLAKNNTGMKDEKGEFEDWVELYNTGTTAIDLSGYYISDKMDNSMKWQIPTGTSIQPGKSILIWCDEDGTDGPLHANFKLSADGENILLFAKDGKTVLDLVTFGAQAADVSTGRLFDGQATWVTYPSPTPLAPNSPLTGGTRLYSHLNPLAHTISLALAGPPKIGTTPTLNFRNGVSNSPFFNVLGIKGAYQPVTVDFTLLLGFPLVDVWQLAASSTGTHDFQLSIPNDVNFVGIPLYMQALQYSQGKFGASNGLEMICTQ